MIETAKAETGPREATLAEVYDLDWALGHRRDDLDLWADLVAPALRIVEVGCGDGRVPRMLREVGRHHWAQWYGIDTDRDMLDEYPEDWLLGEAQDPSTWQALATLLDEPADLVIVPFSSLYLIPHEQQVDVLRGAGGILRAGGVVAVEAFVPSAEFLTTGIRYAVGAVRSPGVEPWVRHTEYRIDAAARITDAVRRYGPPSRYELVVRERIYWRLPNELIDLAGEAGLIDAHLRGDHLVPPGNIVLTARA